MVNAMPRPLYPRKRDAVPIIQEAGGAPRTVLAGGVNLAAPPPPPPGFNPRALTGVVSHYTVYTIAAHQLNKHRGEKNKKLNTYLPSLRMKVPDHVYVFGSLLLQ
jgi:hypothetical protein